jgi:hypothetical protein
MKKKTKKKVQPKREWNSGISPKTTLSYEKYMKTGLEIISQKFSIRTYKLAPKEDYPFFKRGKDLRVRVFFNGKYVEGSEFLIELSFWMQSNGNKEDRRWMRSHADHKLKCFYDAVQRGKKKPKKEKK